LLVDEQSASLPGSVDLVSTLLRRTSSRAFLAASAALKAWGEAGGVGRHRRVYEAGGVRDGQTGRGARAAAA
jgi:hypothetical protein